MARTIVSGMGSAHLASSPERGFLYQEGGSADLIRPTRRVRIQFASTSATVSLEQAKELGYVSREGRLIQGEWVY